MHCRTLIDDTRIAGTINRQLSRNYLFCGSVQSPFSHFLTLFKLKSCLATEKKLRSLMRINILRLPKLLIVDGIRDGVEKAQKNGGKSYWSFTLHQLQHYKNNSFEIIERKQHSQTDQYLHKSFSSFTFLPVVDYSTIYSNIAGLSSDSHHNDSHSC